MLSRSASQYRIICNQKFVILGLSCKWLFLALCPFTAFEKCAIERILISLDKVLCCFRHYKSFAFETLNATFPFPQVFSLSPFPLKREPTVTAWRGTTLSTRINKCRSLIMPPRFVRQAVANNTAQSLVLIVKLGVRFARRLAARIPSSKLHIPFISTPA